MLMKKIKPLIIKTREGSTLTVAIVDPKVMYKDQVVWLDILGKNCNKRWQSLWLTASQCRRIAKQLLLLAEQAKK